MDAAYFKAVVPEPYRIFGLRLLPLSLGRYRLLKRFECGFVAETEAIIGMEDLCLGILICSMRVREFLEFIETNDFQAELARWGQRIRKEIDSDPYFSLLEKFGLFRAYITDGTKIPDYWEEKDPGAAGCGHWAQNLEVTLRSELGYTLEEIEEGPLAKALADYYKHAANQGFIRLISEEEAAQGDHNARLFEQIQKGEPCRASN